MKLQNVIMTLLLVVAVNLLFFRVVFSPRSEKKNSITEQSRETAKSDFFHFVAQTDVNYPTYQDRESASSDYQISRANAVTRTVKEAESSVVSVNVIKTQVVRRNTNPFDNPFFGFFDYRPYRREVQSIGTGIIYRENGYIITNSHVVEGATQIKVILGDQRQLDAEIVGLDSVLDVAVLKIEADNLPVTRLGSSADLMLGETVIAIGNPYAFLIKDSKPSVSVGVVSATNRNFAQDAGGKIYQRMIQTDAAINPGNSGGPLINILGEVIGVNTFIFSESGGNIGIGFAIPIDRVKSIANEVIKYGRRRQIWFGFKIQDLNPMIVSYLGLQDLNGVIVSLIETNSPAAEAGLQRGDIIKNINNLRIRNSEDAEVAISEISVGQEIEFLLLRGNQQVMITFEAVELSRN